MYGSPWKSRVPAPAVRRRRRKADFPSAGVRPVLDGVRRLVQGLRLSAERARKRAGVSGAQLFVLQKLAEADAQSVNDLAARTATDQSSVSAVVHRLADAGLVDRHPDPRDRRRVRLTLTGRGRALLRRCPDSAQQQLVRAIEDLPARERRTFADSLSRIVADMAEAPPVLFFEGEDGRRQGRRRRA